MGSIIEGVAQMVSGTIEGDAASKANKAQYIREQNQADAAIQGARDKGAYETGKLRILNSRVVADQKVAYTNSGVDATSGTAANVQANTAALGEYDAQQAAITAAREVYGYKEGKKQSEQDYWARKTNIEAKGLTSTLGGFAKTAGGMASMGKG